MMTVSGIAAEGLPIDVDSRRMAAESVSPQQLAVFGTDTELRFAVIPVTIYINWIYAAKIQSFFHPTSIFRGKF